MDVELCSARENAIRENPQVATNETDDTCCYAQYNTVIFIIIISYCQPGNAIRVVRIENTQTAVFPASPPQTQYILYLYNNNTKVTDQAQNNGDLIDSVGCLCLAGASARFRPNAIPISGDAECIIKPESELWPTQPSANRIE